MLIILTEKQAEHIMKALDLYSRINIGQVEEIQRAIAIHRPKKYKLKWTGIGEKIYKDLKKHLFPELQENESYGICSKETPDICREMIDIHDVIRYYLAWKNNPEGGITVNFNKPSHYSKNDLPVIEE